MSGRRSPLAVGALTLLTAAVLLHPTSAAAQTPAPTIESRGACLAEVDLVFDVSSIPGAVETRYRVRAGGVNVANVRLRNQTSGRVELDLRSFDRPLLDGVAWTAQVRALAADGSPVAAFSTAAGIPNPDTTPDEAALSLAAASGNAVALSWDLADALEACADQVRWELKGSPFASATDPDPAATTGVTPGASGSATLTAPGPGTYHVRLLALHGGEAATDAIGRWSAAKTATVGAATTQIVRVQAVDADATRCRGLTTTSRPEPRPNAIIMVSVGSGEVTRIETDDAGQAAIELPTDAKQVEITAESRSSGGVCRAEPIAVTLPSRGLLQIALEGCVSEDGDRGVAFGGAGTTTSTRTTQTSATRGAANLPSAGTGGVDGVTVRGVAGLVAPPGELVVELVPETTTPVIGAQPLERRRVLRESFPAICGGEERTFQIPAQTGIPDGVSYAYVAGIVPEGADAEPANDVARSRPITSGSTSTTSRPPTGGGTPVGGGTGAVGVTPTVRVTSANPLDVNLVLGGPAKTVMLAGENLGAATGAVLLDRNGNAVSGVELTLRAAESATIRALDLTAGAGAIVSSYQLALVVPGLPSPPRVETPVTVLVTRAPPRTLEFSTEVMTMTGLGYDNLVLPFTTEAMTMTGLGYDNVVLEFTIEAMTMTGLGYDNLILEFTTTEMIMTGAEE